MGKSQIPELVQRVRKDIDDWLWHFVKPDGNEVKALESILMEGKIRGGVDRYRKVASACFTETPLFEHVIQNRDVFERWGYERLSNFGIGFRKHLVFDESGLPVIYQPNNLLVELGAGAEFRHCTFDLNTGVDFTWQREWRVPGDFEFSGQDDFVIVLPDHSHSGFLQCPISDERDDNHGVLLASYVAVNDLWRADTPYQVDQSVTKADI